MSRSAGRQSDVKQPGPGARRPMATVAAWQGAAAMEYDLFRVPAHVEISEAAAVLALRASGSSSLSPGSAWRELVAAIGCVADSAEGKG